MSDVIDDLLNPRTMAVIGASNDPGKRGYRSIETLLAEHYQGEIIPINPKQAEILGLRCYPSLSAVPQPVDLALICTPADSLPEVITQCGRKGVKGAVVLAGGLSEASESGRLLEERIVEIARGYGLRIIGPNMNGIFSARLNCNTLGWFGIPHGRIAVVSNSANIALSLVTEAQQHGYDGFSTILSVGNQADVQFHEYLSSLGADAGTQAIISYVEGFKQGREYLDVARKVGASKPVVLYKAGRNAEGVRLAKSHSGSLAGDFVVSQGVLKQAGVMLESRSEYLYPVAEALMLLPPMRSRNVALLSEGGGPITIAAEALAERGMVLAQLSEETQGKIRALIPYSSAIANPVDVGAGTDPRAKHYGNCARAILEDPNVDALLFVGYFGGYATRYGAAEGIDECRVSEDLGRMMKQFGKPIVVQSHYADFRTEALDVLRKNGVPFQRNIEVAVECLCAAADHAQAKARIARSVATTPMPGQRHADELIRSSLARGQEALLEDEAKELLEAYGVPVPPRLLIKHADELPQLEASFGSAPLALKIVSPQILHKSDAGGVKLNVRGGAAARSAFEDIVRNAHAYAGDADIRGVLASKMAPEGTEIIIGVARDPQFGPVIMFGLGGVFVEVLKDVVFRALPIAREDAEEMLADIKGKAILDGARGRPAVDRKALVELLLRISAICQTHPEIAELDLNPVIAHADGYSIVDARVIVGRSDDRSFTL